VVLPQGIRGCWLVAQGVPAKLECRGVAPALLAKEGSAPPKEDGAMATWERPPAPAPSGRGGMWPDWLWP